MTDQEIITLIEERREHKALVKLYRYESRVSTLIKKYGGSKEDAQDVFQDALLILCKNVWAGDFKLTSKLDTYLYGVCFNLWRTALKSKKGKEINLPDEYRLEDQNELEALIAKEGKIKQVEEVLKKLGDPCLKLLQLFYYQAKKIKEIMQEMKYKTENTVKVQKYKCIERAKKMIAKV
ncbi:RNA polymerase sigma factor [Parvicella tangerina]|uniref:RNA polymerase sigma-70 region 2 domain-containing protein n=1 Tax=Parvicella tangerina TaxID=2829795 RepID=A0A916N961_9FLAO|nr:sigma-70 family RNA polymerase sigma factor [Parvicella tangerina]CAG5078326.1 hypothetical protein CRYO30217_00642 [Parvicella tangerina]